MLVLQSKIREELEYKYRVKRKKNDETKQLVLEDKNLAKSEFDLVMTKLEMVLGLK